MENKLEQLLNSLIEKGWKPFGVEGIKKAEYKTGMTERGENKIEKRWWTINFTNGVVAYPDGSGEWIFHTDNIRPIVSRESGLWQFVCENGMVKKDQYTNTTRIQEYEDERDSETYRTKYDEGSYLFRLIESSLKDESELEDFLLNSIKLD